MDNFRLILLSNEIKSSNGEAIRTIAFPKGNSLIAAYCRCVKDE